MFYKIILPTFVIGSLLLVIPLSGCGDIEQKVASLSVSPPSKTVGVNQSLVLSVTAYDAFGLLIASPSVTWSVSNGLGSVSSGGVFTAGAGTGECVVTAASGSVSDTAAVTITETGWLTGFVSDNSSRRVGSITVRLTASHTALSELNGNYEISGIIAGTYEVTTNSAELYFAATPESVVITSGETTSKNITINSKLNQNIDLNPPTP